MWLLMGIHIVFFGIVCLLMRAKLLKSPRRVLPFVLLIPVFGAGMLFLQESYERGDGQARKDAGIEKLKINDEIHRSILMEEAEKKIMVPLQEALILNDASVRRELMMSILYDDTSKYVDMLKEARMNEDTEVVHYATTAMVEVQKEYDLRLQEAEREYRTDPDRPGLLESYLELLEEYTGSGLLGGNMLSAQRRRLQELLECKLEKMQAQTDKTRVSPAWAGETQAGKEQAGSKEHDSQGERIWYERYAQNALQLQDYEGAQRAIETLIDRWPDRESGYLLKISFALSRRDREMISEVLELLEERAVYLSQAGRECVRFWQNA